MENVITHTFKQANGSNDEQIVNVIRRQGLISRADIAKLTGLTPPTVTNITSKLLDLGIILEDSIGESSGGRRPLLLKVNPKIAQIIIIHIRSEKMIGYLVDSSFQIHYKENKKIKGMTKEEVIELMLLMIAHCKESATAIVPAIGVVVRGPVKIKEGISVFAPNIGWKNIPIRRIIEEKTGIPTFVENDAKALINGEYYYGSVKDADSMILLKVSHGIGSGIMFNGKMYRGINGSAGEVGHTTIDISGPVCSCGNYGCMEALASENALVDMVVKSIKEGQKSLVCDLVNGELTLVTPNIIYQAATEGDEVAIRILGQVARYLGIGIANLVNIFNPKIVVIGGGIVKARQFIEDIVRQTVGDRSFESCSSVLEIRFSDLATENTMKGVADMVFAEITQSVWLGSR
ncbi:ROK family protein [Pelosinus sp. sgz500959]|uniref:ROK family transcriptional regulator n=1 Tax=Pelosinus sp. sgz500959 TaxID=3242472 RepID=UPI003671A18E